MKLRHEDDDHVFFGVDGEGGVVEAAPAKCADGAEFIERTFCSGDAEAKPEGLVGIDFSKLVVGHKFDGCAAEAWCVAELSAVHNHVCEAGVVPSSDSETTAD